ncbi:transposase [Polycladomyces sp. WAk]|uniref:Transposase n=1 Tax=Polycladomyces zharkentensis TaxID=2807616 RepID=A0ABS2WJ82_9BACL|nr:transposase [Polycladomyces sp. WAk]
MLVQFTAYKAEWAGKLVMEVDPRHTSQVCSECGRIVKKTLKERTLLLMRICGRQRYQCARNILHRAMGTVPEPKYGQ